MCVQEPTRRICIIILICNVNSFSVISYSARVPFLVIYVQVIFPRSQVRSADKIYISPSHSPHPPSQLPLLPHFPPSNPQSSEFVLTALFRPFLLIPFPNCSYVPREGSPFLNEIWSPEKYLMWKNRHFSNNTRDIQIHEKVLELRHFSIRRLEWKNLAYMQIMLKNIRFFSSLECLESNGSSLS